MSVRGGHSGEARSCELGPGRERPWPPGSGRVGSGRHDPSIPGCREMGGPAGLYCHMIGVPGM